MSQREKRNKEQKEGNKTPRANQKLAKLGTSQGVFYAQFRSARRSTERRKRSPEDERRPSDTDEDSSSVLRSRREEEDDDQRRHPRTTTGHAGSGCTRRPAHVTRAVKSSVALERDKCGILSPFTFRRYPLSALDAAPAAAARREYKRLRPISSMRVHKHFVAFSSPQCISCCSPSCLLLAEEELSYSLATLFLLLFRNASF